MNRIRDPEILVAFSTFLGFPIGFALGHFISTDSPLALKVVVTVLGFALMFFIPSFTRRVFGKKEAKG